MGFRERGGKKKEKKRAGAPKPKGPHRTRHARALPGGPAHVGFGCPRATSAGLVRPRFGPVGPGGRNRAEATQIAHARSLPGWHSPAGRQAERKVLLLSVPPWAVQPVSIVPSTHYVSRSPRLSQHPRVLSFPPILCFFSPSFSRNVETRPLPEPLGSTGITSF